MDDKLFQIILTSIPFIFAIVSAVITTFVKPWLDAKIKNETLKNYIEWVGKAVEAAQQTHTPEQWAEKKVYVEKFISGMVGDALTPKQIEILIEAAVKELKLREQQSKEER